MTSDTIRARAIPSNWSWSTLGALGSWYGGGTPSKSERRFWQSGTVPWVSPKDMKCQRILGSQDHITTEGLQHSAARLLPVGSVLVVTRSGILEHHLPAAISSLPLAINQDLKGLVPKEGVLPEFVLYWLRFAESSILHSCSKAGTTVANISFGHFLKFPVPLPPLTEQRQLVDAIEEQFSRLDAAKSALAVVSRRANRLGNAIATAVANAPGAPRKLREIGDVVTGNTPSTKESRYWGGALPFVTPGDLLHAGAVRSARRSISQSAMSVARTVPSRSVLVTCIGATIGKTSMSEIDCAINQQINAIVPDPSLVVPEYLLAVLSGPGFQRKIHERASSTTLPILSKAKLSDLSLNVPPLESQRRIMREFCQFLSVRDSAATLIERAVSQSHRLRSAILGCAFTGNLVLSDQRGEPSMLPEAAPQGGHPLLGQATRNGEAQFVAESEARA